MAGRGGRLDRVPEEAWVRIGLAFEDGDDISSIVDTYGITRQAVYKQAKKRGWVRGDRDAMDVQSDVDQATTAKLIGVSSPDSEWAEDDEDPRYTAAINAAADDRVALIGAHRLEWQHIRRLGRAARRAALDPNWTPPLDPGQELEAKPERLTYMQRLKWAGFLADVFKKLSEATVTQQEGERRAYGFDYKLQQDQKPVDPVRDASAVDAVLQGLNALMAAKRAGIQIEGKANA